MGLTWTKPASSVVTAVPTTKTKPKRGPRRCCDTGDDFQYILELALLGNSDRLMETLCTIEERPSYKPCKPLKISSSAGSSADEPANWFLGRPCLGIRDPDEYYRQFYYLPVNQITGPVLNLAKSQNRSLLKFAAVIIIAVEADITAEAKLELVEYLETECYFRKDIIWVVFVSHSQTSDVTEVVNHHYYFNFSNQSQVTAFLKQLISLTSQSK